MPDSHADTPRVSYAFDLRNNHYHLSLLYAGLATLASEGRIQLDWRTAPGDELDSSATDGMIARLLIERGGETQRTAIDLFDRSDLFDATSLSWCDRYLKRSHYEPDVLDNAGQHAAKVAPFGMNYACRCPEADRLVFGAIVRQAAVRGFASPRALAGQLLGQRNTLRTYAALPRLTELVAPPSAPRVDRVLFQTRVWDPEDVTPDDPEEINGLRADTVRALRSEFGERFLGGLVPTPFALRHYPDLLTTASTRRRDFIQLVKTSSVVVYTRGLHHSIAFKLPEYLASSGVIVSEPLRNAVAPPLCEQVAWADSTAESIAITARSALLNPRSSTRAATHRYFLAHASPTAVVARAIGLA